MKSRPQIIVGFLATISVLAWATAAQAQVAPDPAGASPSGGVAPVASSDNADILVTARKRSESLLDVPISISAFSGDQLVRAGINTVGDIQNSVPNLQYSVRGDLENQISIRGVGGDPRNVGTESGVSLYIDGVYAGRTAGYNQDLSNISQLEILRGPQGTLFGKNTTGGVINIITEKPSDTFKGQFRGSYGNYNALVLKGTVSGPLTGNLFAGITLSANTRDGYVRNLFDNRKLDDNDRRGGRLQLVWNSPAAINFYWTADHSTNTVDFALTQLVPPFAGSGLPYAGVNSRFVTSLDQSNMSRLNTTGATQTIDYQFGDGPSLTAVSAYRKTNILLYSDSDSLPIDTVHSGPFTDFSHFFSQEVRLASPDTGLIRYVVGGYYFHQKASAVRSVFVGGSLPAGFFTTAEVITDSIAGFANVDVHPTSTLTITGGVRYTSELKKGEFLQRNRTINYDFDDLRRRDNDVSWTGSVNFRPVESLSLYATASRGFKSGGFNVESLSVAGVSSQSRSFAPEKLLNYEIGAKGRALDGRLTFSASAFYDTFDNKQVSQFLGAVVPVIQISNAGKARIKGFEVEAAVKPTSIFTVSGSVSRLYTRYLAFPDAARVNGVLVSYTGNKLENAPAWSADGAVDARAPISFGFLAARAEVRYTGNTYFQPDNAPGNLQKGYTLLQGRFGFETENGLTSVSLWGKNLTNKSYYVFSRFNGPNHQALYGEPRTYGVELIQKF